MERLTYSVGYYADMHAGNVRERINQLLLEVSLLKLLSLSL